MSHSPNSQDSGGSDLDLDPMEAKLFPEGELLGEQSVAASHLLEEQSQAVILEHLPAPLGWVFSVPWAHFIPLRVAMVHGDGGTELGQWGSWWEEGGTMLDGMGRLCSTEWACKEGAAPGPAISSQLSPWKAPLSPG